MSTTYQIGCMTCKEHIWIAQTGRVKGQDPETYLYVYSGEQLTMNLLSAFLQKHMSNIDIYLGEPEHVLVFADSNRFWDEDGWMEIDTTKPGYENVDDS